MNPMHTPDPEFVERCAQELQAAARRQETLNGTSTTGRKLGLRFGPAVALAVVAMLVGGAGAHAFTRGVDRQAADLYIARGEALLEVAHTRLERFAVEMTEARAQGQQGIATEREVLQAEVQYASAEYEFETRRLELDETRMTGKKPNDALSAPLVEGRDFVTERLAAQRNPLHMQLKLAVTQEQRSRELHVAGVLTDEDYNAAQLDVVIADAKAAALEERIALRASFLSGELSSQEVQWQEMRLSARLERDLVTFRLKPLLERRDRLAGLAEQGIVTQNELRAAEVELRAAQMDVQLADLELQILDEKLASMKEQ
jgi:hypothetical protein